jgi:hypothetical protein
MERWQETMSYVPWREVLPIFSALDQSNVDFARSRSESFVNGIGDGEKQSR